MTAVRSASELSAEIAESQIDIERLWASAASLQSPVVARCADFAASQWNAIVRQNVARQPSVALGGDVIDSLRAARDQLVADQATTVAAPLRDALWASDDSDDFDTRMKDLESKVEASPYWNSISDIGGRFIKWELPLRYVLGAIAPALQAAGLLSPESVVVVDADKRGRFRSDLPPLPAVLRTAIDDYDACLARIVSLEVGWNRLRQQRLSAEAQDAWDDG